MGSSKDSHKKSRRKKRSHKKRHIVWRVLLRILGFPLQIIWTLFFSLPAKGFKKLGELLRGPAYWLGRFMLLPIDLAFLVYDFFAVNFSKTKLTKKSCRKKMLPGSEPYCRPCRKYTNRGLFRLICPDVYWAPHTARPLCGAGKKRSMHLLPGALTALVILGMASGAVWGIIAFWPELNPEGDRTEQRLALLKARRQRGAELFTEGKFKEAVSVFKRIVNNHPRDPQAHLNIALCYEQMGKEKDAEQHFKWAAEADDPPPLALKWLTHNLFADGMVKQAADYARSASATLDEKPWWAAAVLADRMLARGKLQEAQELLHTARSEAPDEDLTKLVHAVFLSRQGEAREALKKLSAISSDSALGFMAGLRRVEVLSRIGQPDKVLDTLKELADAYPKQAEPAILRVRLLFDLGRREEALSEAEAILDSYYQQPTARLAIAQLLSNHGQLGRALQIALGATKSDIAERAHVLAADIYREKGLYELAAEHASAALSKESKSRSGLLCLARTDLARGRPGDAARSLQQLTELAPKNSTVWHTYGKALRAAGKLKEAEKAWRKACELSPQSGKLHRDLGVCLLAQDKVKEARQELERAVALSPNLHEAHTRLGMLAEEAGNLEQAAGHYEKALSVAPSKAVAASNNLADLLLRQDRNVAVALALSHFAHVQAAGQPYWPETADTYAQALMKLGHAEAGRLVAQQAAQQHPDSPIILYRLATILDKMDKKEKALEQVRKALKTNKEFPGLKKAQKLAQRLKKEVKATSEK